MAQSKLGFIFSKAFEAMRDSILILLRPTTKISFLRPFEKYLSPTKPEKPEDATQGTVDSLEEIMKTLADPATDPITNWLMRFTMAVAVLPFSLGSAAGILAEKNMLRPIRRQVRPNLLSPGDGLESLWRKFMTQDEVKELLKTHGYEDADVDRLVSLSKFIPGAQDVIHFAVREVYRPETARLFGQFEGLDEVWEQAKADVEAGKMDKETFAKYWAAHWGLPSIMQGFEMLHRGLITRDDLAKLLVAADVMPFWRDKLLGISYNPLTRVDVRRMHKIGVLKNVDLPRKFQDVGYSKENAELMAQFTIKYNGDPESAEQTESDRQTQKQRDLTKTDVLGGYADGLLSRQDALNLLVTVGFDQEEIEYLLLREDFKREESLLKKSVEELHKAFVRGTHSEDQTRDFLARLNVDAAYVEKLFEGWTIEIEVPTALPTKAELLKWLAAGKVSPDTVATALSRLGYAQEWINLYMAEPEPKDG